MKPIIFFIALFITVCGYAQTADIHPDAILHKWEMQDKSARMFFRKSGNTYEAVQIYSQEQLEADGKTYKQDALNPDPALRDRSLNNYVFIKNLVFENGRWTHGKLYNYRDGKQYDVTITIDGDVMSMRVFKGIPRLGKTLKWNKIE